MKGLVLPGESSAHQSARKRMHKHIWKLSLHCQGYFDPRERRAILDEILPYFSCSDISNAYIVAGALNALLPSDACPPTESLSQPADLLPTFFHIWSLVGRSKTFDIIFVDILSRLAKDHLQCRHVRFNQHGIFTKEQSDLLFTAILRFTEIPVGQAHSPYSHIDYSSGLGMILEKDKKKYPPSYMAARLIVASLSPMCLDKESSIIANLEGLMESIDTFFHPSNQGGWTTFLAQLTWFLADTFVARYNKEQTGEMDIPSERRINDALKRRFVLALKEVTFMGLFAKGSKVVNYYHSTLQSLAFLEPDLILPGALQRFYPSLQGLVEVHRTTSSLCGLQMIANVMSKTKGYRCHITALLALALPGIDANDLGKTQYTLNFFQSVAYSIPFVPLTKEDGAIHDTTLAMQWVQGEMERMEREGQDVKIDYATELADEDERNIVRSSTAGFGEFIMTLLGKVFTLLENLPDASNIRTGSPEENVINTLPAALTPLFATLSPDLFDMALEKLSTFVSSHVVHQARDAMAWICSAMCKTNPEKTLKVFIPMLIVNIRNEIDYNGAASDRSSGTDVLPRDRALVWHVSILSMCVVHVGEEVLKYSQNLYELAGYMHEKCKGLATIHISNFSHHLLLNLTHMYPIDNALYEPSVMERGLDVDDWGRTTNPSELSIRWHRPNKAEIAFAVEFFEAQAKGASLRLEALMSDNPPVSRKGKNKEWSDEVTRHLSHLKLILSGMSTLFDPQRATGQANGHARESDGDTNDEDEVMDEEEDDSLAEYAEDEELRPQFRYDSGYVMDRQGIHYARLHDCRESLGQLLSTVHSFLCSKQEDDVACFTSLYSVYRTWITDVGIERSAHPLERLSRLYKNDVSPFRISGMRKVYPRPLLVRRADLYYLQRVKHNASARQKSDLDKKLLLDLADSCVSTYAEVRRVAQGAQDSSLKVLVGGRPLVIPIIMDKFRKALDEKDHDRIKGSMFTLLFTSLTKTLIRDWRFATDFMRLYIASAKVDKPSIQVIGSQSLYALIDFGKPFERIVIVNDEIIDTIKPDDDCSKRINSRHEFIEKRRKNVEDKKHKLGLELTELAQQSHWKIASRCAIFASNMSLRFDTLAPPEFVDLVVKGTNDPHPGLRANYASAFSNVFTLLDMRACYQHDYRNFLLEKELDENKMRIQVPADPDWTDKFLAAFASPDEPKYFVDADQPGWLVWGKDFQAYVTKPKQFNDFDEAEMKLRRQIGSLVTKDWFNTLFGYLKQEPRDASADRFRMTNVMLLMHLFDLVSYDLTMVTFDEITEMTLEVYGDGSDKHQHRATSEIIGAMLTGSSDDHVEYRDRVWSFAAPFMLRVFSEALTPENTTYWMTCLHLVVDSKDPRRSHEILNALSSFRLDINSNAAFKDSSQIQLLEFLVNDAGWHFMQEKPILDHFLAHINHPYKSVREAMGRIIATIYRTRYHESFPNVAELLEANKNDSSVGIRPYQPTAEFADTIREVFDRIDQWRREREPGQQDQSDYTCGSKTVLTWLDAMLTSHECTMLIPFFPDPFMPQLLHMMDVKEDPELMRLAYHVYRHMPNITFRNGEDLPFIQALINIGRTSSSWHQRLRALVNMQVIYFRRLFLTPVSTRDMLFDAVGDMLGDSQLEVRSAAGATLAGMIRCSPKAIRDPIIQALKTRFEEQLRKYPMPKRKVPGTDTPIDMQRQVIKRHAAVLGLGALIEAFPYATPPPKWMPEVLAHLATRAAGDPGIVGKATKSILSEFKKTRQDSWTVDQKV